MEHVGFLTARQIDAYMRKQEMSCYREYFMWGKTPAYRNREQSMYRFYDQGEVLTPTEMLTRLVDTWRPAARDAREYAAGQMREELEELSNRERIARIVHA